MKKIIYILLLAVVALSFMGCPTVYKDRDYEPLVIGDVVGDMNGDGLVLSALDGVPGGFKTVSFTYANEMAAWGNGNGKCAFKIRAVPGDWAVSYGFDSAKKGSFPAGITMANAGGNIELNGLVAGTTYHFELVASSKDITISLIED